MELKSVHFSYDGEKEVLKDISLTIPEGRTVAFVGPSGGGKTTLANLISRFFDPQSGMVKIGGVNVKDIPKEETHEYGVFRISEQPPGQGVHSGKCAYGENRKLPARKF